MYLPKPTEGDFQITPAGTFMAVCYRVLDLGTQAVDYKGETKMQHKIMLSWELPDELMDDGRPFTVSKRYTWSMHAKSTLRKHLEGWRGAAFKETDFGEGGFNIKNVIGKGCLVTVTHTEREGKTYANVDSVSKLMKGMSAPDLVNPQVYLWLDKSVWSADVFHTLGKGLQEIILKSPEYQELHGVKDDEPPPPNGENDYGGRDPMDQDIPF